MVDAPASILAIALSYNSNHPLILFGIIVVLVEFSGCVLLDATIH